MKFSFLHAADLHIDSPVENLRDINDGPGKQLRGATRKAFQNVIDLALKHRVDFVLVAGDLFDGPWRNMETGLFAASQFRRLQEIPVSIVQGNHDADSVIVRDLTWPANVRRFSTSSPETIHLESLGIAIHGFGFEERECKSNPLPSFPQPVKNAFNIGLLHTNVGGNDKHDSYLPTNLNELQQHGYDYWALGHVHARDILSQSPRPWIVYPGNTQGRHINEQGAKGCYVVKVEDGNVEPEFHPTDVARWHVKTVEAEESDDLDDIVKRAREVLCETVSQDECFAALRLYIRGRCAAHRELVHSEKREELRAKIRNEANDLGSAWIEEIIWETEAPIDLEQLRRAQDIRGEIFRNIREVIEDDQQIRELSAKLALFESRDFAPYLSQAGLKRDDETMRRWLLQAERILGGYFQEVE